MTLTTAEWELVGYTEALQCAESILALLELMQLTVPKVLEGDRRAALAQIQNDGGSWPNPSLTPPCVAFERGNGRSEVFMAFSTLCRRGFGSGWPYKSVGWASASTFSSVAGYDNT